MRSQLLIRLLSVAVLAGCSKQPAPVPAAPEPTTPEPAPVAVAEPAPVAVAEPAKPEPVPEPATPEPTPEPAAALGANVDKACAKLAEANASKLTDLRKLRAAIKLPRGAPEPMLDAKLFAGCKKGPGGTRGAWLLELQRGSFSQEGGDYRSEPIGEFAVAVTFVGDDGVPVRYGASEDETNVITGDLRQLMITIAEVADLDHDGQADAVIESQSDQPDQHNIRYKLVRVKRGAAVELAVARDGRFVDAEADDRLAIDAVTDIDGDGRLDLESSAPFAFPGTMNDWLADDLAFVLHGTASGFAADDEATRAYYVTTCGGEVRPEQVPDNGALGSVLKKAVCARLYGGDAAAIGARWDKAWTAEMESPPEPAGAVFFAAITARAR